MESPAFNMAEQTKDFLSGDVISIAGALNLNTYRGTTSAQFITRNIRVSPEFEITKHVLADVFKCINKHDAKGISNISCNSFINTADGNVYSMSTVLIALKIFSELDILSFEFDSDKRFVKVSKGINYNTKNDLCISNTYKLYNGKEV